MDSPGLWGLTLSDTFFLESAVSYQVVKAKRLNGVASSAGQACERSDQDFLYYDHSDQYISLSVMPGYKIDLPLGFSLLLSAGGIANFNLASTRQVTYRNIQSDTRLDLTIKNETGALPANEDTNSISQAYSPNDFFNSFGVGLRTAIQKDRIYYNFSVRLGFGVEKYFLKGAPYSGNSGYILMAPPASIVTFRASIDFIYHL